MALGSVRYPSVIHEEKLSAFAEPVRVEQEDVHEDVFKTTTVASRVHAVRPDTRTESAGNSICDIAKVDRAKVTRN